VLGIILGVSIALERATLAQRVAAVTAATPLDPVRTAIDRLNARYLEALRVGDPQAYADLFADDAMQLPAVGEAIRGRTAIVAAMTAAFERVHFLGGSLQTLEVRCGGPTAYEVGAYSFSVRDRDAGSRRKSNVARNVSGRYAVIWRLQRGRSLSISGNRLRR
jgi:uncharacterized protein (TIGR02246 family)